MIPTRRTPTSPGEILDAEFLRPLGITQTALAKHIGVPIRRINEIVRGRRAVTSETAQLLAAALGTIVQEAAPTNSGTGAVAVNRPAGCVVLVAVRDGNSVQNGVRTFSAVEVKPTVFLVSSTTVILTIDDRGGHNAGVTWVGTADRDYLSQEVEVFNVRARVNDDLVPVIGILESILDLEESPRAL